jgi:hypothetical protein
MHYKEYYSAGDDAKLLLAQLPNVELFIFGKEGEWERFESELSIDPTHNLVLWPGEDALCIEEFLAGLPDESGWKGTATTSSTETSSATSCDVHTPTATTTKIAATTTTGTAGAAFPLLRVVLLDGVYNHARNMFKSIRTRLPPSIIPPYVALKPKTLSVYHRATKKYGNSSNITIQSESSNHGEDNLRICTVEAYALLLKELGEEDDVTQRLVNGVVVNNNALKGVIEGKIGNERSGAGKRKLKRINGGAGNQNM